MFSNIKSAHLRRNWQLNIMKSIHQNCPKEGIFLKISGASPPDFMCRTGQMELSLLFIIVKDVCYN